MLAPLKKKFYLDDDALPVVAPQKQTSRLPDIDDEVLHIVVEEDSADVKILASFRQTALLQIIDEELSFVVEEDDTEAKPVISLVRAAKLEVIDEERSFVVEEDDTETKLIVPPVRAAKLELVDEELSFVVEEDDTEAKIIVPLIRSARLELVDEELSFVVEEDDTEAKLIIPPVKFAKLELVDEELSFVVEEDDTETRLLVPPVRYAKLESIDDETFTTPPSFQPSSTIVQEIPRGSGGGGIADGCERYGDRYPEFCEPEFWVFATSLPVEIFATMLPVVVTERGNVLYFVASFPGEPDQVYFSYIRPGESRPRVDPGYGHAKSRIMRDDEGHFRYAIDTTGFEGGVLLWHFWGTGAGQASGFGEVKIRERPAQLL